MRRFELKKHNKWQIMFHSNLSLVDKTMTIFFNKLIKHKVHFFNIIEHNKKSHQKFKFD